MSASTFGDRGRRLRLAAASLSLLTLATPLLADEIDLASSTAPVEVESSSAIQLAYSNQATAVGDLNDDGDLDLVVGAAGDGTITGAAYVIFGPLSSLGSPYDLSTDADVLVTGGQANGALGVAVAVGDLNSDGDQDLVVSAPKADGPSSRTDSGAVYVFYGPLSAGTLDISLGDADLVIYGDDAGDQLGTTLTIANLTGSADLDLGMGAPFADGYLNALADAGEVNFINGPLSTGTWDLDSTAADEIIWGGGAGQHLFMAKVGELSGDANVDIAVGLFGNATPVAARASLRVIFGPISTGADFNLNVISADWRAGGEYTFPGDILIADFDADGQNDLLATAPIDEVMTADSGVVFGFLGPLSGSVSDSNWNLSDLQIAYPDYTSNKGHATSLAFHDISADGTADLIIGAIGGAGPNDDRTYAGRVDVFYGPVAPKTYDMTTDPAQLTVHGDDGMYLGQDVIAGDFDNDGKRDLVMLAGREATGVSSTGKLHILAGETCYFDAFDDGIVNGGWTLLQLGTANQGSRTEAGGVLDLTGDGTGIYGISDDAVFLYRDDVSGDFRVEATIVGLPTNAGGADRRGGLWVRSNDTPPLGYTVEQAPYVAVNYQPVAGTGGGGQLQFIMRQDWGEGGSPPNEIVPIGSPVDEGSSYVLPVRVAIERTGSEFCVYYFNNNDSTPQWQKPAGGQGGCTRTTGVNAQNHPVINSQPDIGLMVAADHASTTATYRFDDYAICRP